MSTNPTRLQAPSLVALATEAIRAMILEGELGPGERLREEQLAERLGISRPPLREALRLLEREGLVVATPRRGVAVTELSDQDVREILTLRSALERLAIELGVPVTDPARLRECHQALAQMEECARKEDRAGLVERGYAFHSAIVALAGHRRLLANYHSLHDQLLLCMAMNLYARENFYEDLVTHVERHRELLEVIESGDPDAVLEALAAHGERSFTKHEKRPNKGKQEAEE